MTFPAHRQDPKGWKIVVRCSQLRKVPGGKARKVFIGRIKPTKNDCGVGGHPTRSGVNTIMLAMFSTFVLTLAMLFRHLKKTIVPRSVVLQNQPLGYISQPLCGVGWWSASLQKPRFLLLLFQVSQELSDCSKCSTVSHLVYMFLVFVCSSMLISQHGFSGFDVNRAKGNHHKALSSAERSQVECPKGPIWLVPQGNGLKVADMLGVWGRCMPFWSYIHGSMKAQPVCYHAAMSDTFEYERLLIWAALPDWFLQLTCKYFEHFYSWCFQLQFYVSTLLQLSCSNRFRFEHVLHVKTCFFHRFDSSIIFVPPARRKVRPNHRLASEKNLHRLWPLARTARDFIQEKAGGFGQDLAKTKGPMGLKVPKPAEKKMIKYR